MSGRAGPSKKSKTYYFHAEWEEDFFFTLSYSKCVCLICKSTIAISKKGNVERHFRKVHKNYNTDFPPKSELRKRKVKELKSQLSGLQPFYWQPTTRAKATTEASFRVSHCIVKHKKSFEDGEMVKEAFVEAADSLFRGFKNKPQILSSIEAVQLSTTTVTQHSEAIAVDLTRQLWMDITDCQCFSLQFDESTDVSDTAQLCIFIRMVFSDMTAKEELLTLLPMKQHASGKDIFQSFKNFKEKTQLPVCKLVSITTDGAPAVVGRSNGFIAKCREDDAFPDFLNYHCIRDLCPEIKEFFHVAKYADYNPLNDNQWLLDLAFLTDLTSMLNGLDVELQEKDKTIINMISSCNAFKRKMQHLSAKMQRNDLANFNNLALELETQGKACAQLDNARYIGQIENCLSEFDRCFQDFLLLEPVATFMCYPFRVDADVDSLPSEIATLFDLNSSGVEDEILTIQSDIQLRSRAHGQFWNLLAEEKYPNLRKCASSLTALFGSTYLCESAISHMKIIKSKYLSTLTHDHLEVYLRLAISSYCPDYASLAGSVQFVSSE